MPCMSFSVPSETVLQSVHRAFLGQLPEYSLNADVYVDDEKSALLEQIWGRQ